MTTGYRNSSGVDFDDVFDPYVQGTKPGATGYRTSDGVDLNQRYAPLSFGTAAAVQGYRLSGGADVNTLWAAKGTAQYSLPFNGQTYSKSYTVPPGGSGFAAVFFSLTSASAWQISGSSTGGSGPVYLTGAVPTGAVSCQATGGAVTTPPTEAAGDATWSNNMTTPTALATGLTAKLQTAVWGDTSGTHGSQANLTITFYNGSGSAISTSTCLFILRTDGSA